ncbi:G patch domain-containing protein 3-like [Ornithodoros turicata]|uniref:G patch domain-containing protein 3-like n=1 Tax=Ornithodoros turicata TaxID=34597 RepID=UPI003139E9A6
MASCSGGGEDRRKNVTYVIINNIPKTYHAADLRNFFSEFIETCGFDCCHFRHRPEVQKVSTAPESTGCDNAATRKVTTCCIARVLDDRVDAFLRTYDKKHWVGRDGQTLPTKCFIKRARVKPDGLAKTQYRTRKEIKASNKDHGAFTESDLKNLIEMHPPQAMPNGNVGTPTKVFLDMIRACKLPPYIIKKLGLEFPRMRAKGMYGSVAFDYGNKPNKVKVSHDAEMVRTARGDIISDAVTPHTNTGKERLQPDSDDEVGKEQDEEESDDEECEEWDRHASLHNDVTSQERTRQRLFEEEMEVVWEKGGSGLVFYTDAQHWDEVEGDFDAKTSDDWDVDMSVYYNPGAGDKDARDFVSMRHFDRLRDGTETDDDNRLASFEKHTKGFGSRIMKEQGWSQGKGLGKSFEGMSVPIDDAGQHPWDRSGFGFRGEKLVRHFRKKRRRGPWSRNGHDPDVLITTIYDDHTVTDPVEPLLRSHEPTYIRFKKPFVKEQQP